MTVSNSSEGSLTGLPARWARAAAAGGAAALGAGYWDDSWHTDQGRDSALIAPHLLLYAAVAAVGLVVTWWGVRTARVRHSVLAPLRQPPIRLAGLGGAAVLTAAPIDAAWHGAYGRDAVLWSPSHMLAVFGAAAMTVGLLLGMRPDAGAWTRAALGAVLLGVGVMPVMEYEADAPQFSQAWYLPVLLVGGLSAVAAIRASARPRLAATRAVALYCALRVVTALVLALLGRSRPDLPLAVLGFAAADLPWPTTRRRLLAAAAAVSAAATVASAAGFSSVPVSATWPYSAATAAMLVLDLLTPAMRRLLAAAGVVLLAVPVIVTGTAHPAAAHDPGQGPVLDRVMFTSRAAGPGHLAVRINALSGCAGLRPARLLARRAGHTEIAALTASAPCVYTGTVAAPASGRWFVYAQFQTPQGAAETWLALTPGAAPAAGQRDLYLSGPSAGRGLPASEVAWGIGLYAAGVALLAAALRGVRRTGAPGGSANGE